MSLAKSLRVACLILAATLPFAQKSWATTYYVDCVATTAGTAGTIKSPLHSIEQINALQLVPGDSLLFNRGTRCEGQLQPHGSGTAVAPIRIAAYGEGTLPQIVASARDTAVVRLADQEFWEIESLELSGANTYGLFVEAGSRPLRHIVLRDLLIHDVRGALKHKESGLIVLHATSQTGRFDDILVDSVQAFNTTQWSGIFIADAAHVQVRNSIVHDVQGDGIVVFRSSDAIITHSLTWHTGMQHQLTIGTPNAIWTWHCTDCTVEENEAFLSDSPGIDGGAFDIDYGNMRNTVQRNFGHDTAGYCVSVFGAFTPTVESIVADNLCRNNGLTPRLAQRQGALLLMTWQGGSIDGLTIRGNRIDWNPSGDTPAIQSGENLEAAGVVLTSNQIHSSGISFIDPTLKYAGDKNIYITNASSPNDFAEANTRYLRLPEKGSTLTAARAPNLKPSPAGTWSLIMTAPEPSDAVSDRVRSSLVQLASAALQYGHAGLQVSLITSRSIAALAADWRLPIPVTPSNNEVTPRANDRTTIFSIKLVSPTGKIAQEWKSNPGPVELGLALQENVGAPNFAYLPFEDVRATD